MSASDTQGGTVTRKGFRLGPRQIFALIVLVVVVIFIAQNRDEVKVNLFTATFTAPLWLLLTIMTVLGLLLGALLQWRAGKARKD